MQQICISWIYLGKIEKWRNFACSSSSKNRTLKTTSDIFVSIYIHHPLLMHFRCARKKRKKMERWKNYNQCFVQSRRSNDACYYTFPVKTKALYGVSNVHCAGWLPDVWWPYCKLKLKLMAWAFSRANFSGKEKLYFLCKLQKVMICLSCMISP